MLDWAIVAARFLQFTFGLVLFGSSLFYLYGLVGGSAHQPVRRWDWKHLALLASALLTLLGVLIQILAQKAVFFPDTPALDATSLRILLAETGFGQVLLVRIGLIFASVAMLLLVSPGTGLWATQTVIGAVIAGSFAWTGHGVLHEGVAGRVHTMSDVIHILTAGVWIGALVPLSILLVIALRKNTVDKALRSLRGLESFSNIGTAVVVVLIATGVINSWYLIGIARWPALFTTTYGLLLVLKLVLLGLMLVLAARNRFLLSPHLKIALERAASAGDFAEPANAVRALRRSVVTETVLVLFVLLSVAYFGTLEAPILSTQ